MQNNTAPAYNVVFSGKLNKQIPSDGKELLKSIAKFRDELEMVESHVYVTIPVVYKVVCTYTYLTKICN